MLDLQKKLTTYTIAKQTNSSTTCPEHNDPLKVYCETCCQVICRDCTISKEHNTHTFYLISECYPKHHQQLQDTLDQVKHKTADIDTAVTHLAAREKEVLQQGQQLKEQINTHAQKVIDRVQRSRTHLSQQVDTIVQHKTQVLTAQRQQAQKIHTQLKTCQDMIEQCLKEWTEQQILTEKLTMMDQMNTTTQKVDPTVFQPIENADIKFTETNIVEEEIGLVTSTMFEKATLKASPCSRKQLSTATLTLQSKEGSSFFLPPSLVSSTLISPGSEQTVKCGITETHPGVYNISFTPSTRGAHILTVQVGGVDIPDSPFTLPVIPTPQMRGEPVNIVTAGLNLPWGIAVCDNGDIVVAENGAHCITILNRNGRKVKSFGTRGTRKGQFECPRGVAISNDEHILVTDDHRLQKLTTDGVCVKSVGSSNEGSDPLQFNYPIGIAVHPTTGQIFVADTGNNHIQFFTKDLTFLHKMTHEYISRPYDVALDNEGYLYIAGYYYFNPYITKHSTAGKYIERMHVFTSCGLESVFHLTIHNNLVYVSDQYDHRVSIYNITGKLLHSFCKEGRGRGEFNGPLGIAADSLGNLYICDSVNNRIVVC